MPSEYTHRYTQEDVDEALAIYEGALSFSRIFSSNLQFEESRRTQLLAEIARVKAKIRKEDKRLSKIDKTPKSVDHSIEDPKAFCKQLDDTAEAIEVLRQQFSPARPIVPLAQAKVKRMVLESRLSEEDKRMWIDEAAAQE